MTIDSMYILVFLQSYVFDTEGGKPIGFEIGIADLPRLDSSVPTDVTYNEIVNSFAVPKTSKYPAEGYRFAKFIGDDNTDLWNLPLAAKNAKVEDQINYLKKYTD